MRCNASKVRTACSFHQPGTHLVAVHGGEDVPLGLPFDLRVLLEHRFEAAPGAPRRLGRRDRSVRRSTGSMPAGRASPDDNAATWQSSASANSSQCRNVTAQSSKGRSSATVKNRSSASTRWATLATACICATPISPANAAAANFGNACSASGADQLFVARPHADTRRCPSGTNNRALSTRCTSDTFAASTRRRNASTTARTSADPPTPPTPPTEPPTPYSH